MRITGLATGMDMDQIIKDTMKPYRVKIQQTQQNRDIVEIKQQLYREVIKESRDFYNKHLDVTKSDSILLSKNWSNVSFTSSNSSAVTVKGLGGASAENYTIDVEQMASTAKSTLLEATYEDTNNKIIQVKIGAETVEINLDGIDRDDNSAVVDAINTELTGKSVKAKYSTISGGIVFESTAKGASQSFEVTYGDTGIENTLGQVTGTDARVKITNSAGTTYTYTGESNKVILDNTEFTFNDLAVDVKITPSVNATTIKDKLVAFIKDYNTLMEKFKTLTTEKRDKKFMPLTDDQKKEMSDDEVTLWEGKVKTGQLSRDSDLTRIANNMKSATKSIFSGNLAFLEEVGIKPVADYSGTKNGSFTIDEDKLTAALENSGEDVMKLFISSKPTDEAMSEEEKYANTGIAQRIKTIVSDETVTTKAVLLKKAGIEGTSTVSNNELTLSIQKYEKKMADMETIFSRREQQLYSKYARLETMMNQLNAQQSNLMSQLGMS